MFKRNSCDANYMGYTSRHLQSVRIEEKRYSVSVNISRTNTIENRTIFKKQFENWYPLSRTSSSFELLSLNVSGSSLTLMYKVNCNITPDKITNLLSIANPYYNLRNSNHFVLPRLNLDIGRNSLRYRGPIEWELTPTALKQSCMHAACSMFWSLVWLYQVRTVDPTEL